MSLEIKGEIEKLSLGPDDVLVVSVPQHLSPQARQNMTDGLRAAFGEDRRVVVLQGGAKLSLVAPPLTDEQREALVKGWRDRLDTAVYGTAR